MKPDMAGNGFVRGASNGDSPFSVRKKDLLIRPPLRIGRVRPSPG